MNSDYYFSHNYNTTSDPKIICLLGEYGGLGYAIFWRIVELLHIADDSKIIVKPLLLSTVAQQMSTNAEQVLKCIDFMIDTCELFYRESGFIYSPRVIENKQKRKDISTSRSAAGKASAAARAALVEQVSTNVNKEKERKGKERKDFIPPSLVEVKKYFDENGYTEFSAQTAYEYYTDLNWHDKFGTPIQVWKTKMRQNWFEPKNEKPRKKSSDETIAGII